MTLILWLLTFVLLAWLGVNALVWTLALGVLALLTTLVIQPAWPVTVLGWIIFLAVGLFLNLPHLRRQYITQRLFNWYKNVLPGLSETEQEALDAGDVSWDGELFTGNPDWRKLLSYPKPQYTEEEKAFIEGPVETLCQMLNDWEITYEKCDLNAETWKFLKEHKFFGMIIPKDYGGLGFSAYAHSAVVMKISTRSISAAVTVMVPNSLGPAELLLQYGTEEQKNYYLPRLATGEEMPCFALTSPKAGSDAAAMPDTGIVCKGQWEGQEVLGLRLNWEKRYITLAPVATLLGLAFKARDPDHLLGDETELGISCALLPVTLPGIEIGARHLPLNAVFMNGPVRGKDVFIPISHVIGGHQNLGKGWRMLMNSLSAGRSISLPALSTGSGKLSAMTTGAYARIREQFGLPIGQFEGIETLIAKIGGLTYLMDAGRLFTAAIVDLGLKPAVPSAILKYHNTELMRQVVGCAMDVHAGRGVIKGPRNYIARVYQAIPISITVEGANVLTRNLMIFGQGGIRCHPFILREMAALQETDQAQGLVEFDACILEHVGKDIQTAVRSLILGLSHGIVAIVPEGGSTRRYYQHLTRFSANFFILADVTMGMLGAKLKFKEKTSARLGDILSHLYLASAVLKHFHDQGRQKEDEPLMRFSMDHCLYEIQQAMDDLLKNYPASRFISVLLRLLVFPLGRRFKKPSDKLESRVAQLLLSPTQARARLIEGAYWTTHPADPVGRVENAFLKVMETETAHKKIKRALKAGDIKETSTQTIYAQAVDKVIMTSDEARALEAADKAVWEAIQVDEFSPETLPDTAKSD